MSAGQFERKEKIVKATAAVIAAAEPAWHLLVQMDGECEKVGTALMDAMREYREAVKPKARTKA